MADIIGRGGKPAPEAPSFSGEPDRDGEAARDTRFKKGNTFGKGRPKGAKNLKTMVNQALSAKVSAKLGGKMQSLTKAELAIHQLANKASAGDPKAIDRVITLHERFGPQEDPSGPSPEEIKADIETLRDYLTWYDLRNGSADEASDG